MDGPYIAKWFKNQKGAISLRFDDGLDSHINIAIPILNKYGLKGTFMTNPGKDRYKSNKTFWETEIPRMGHRLGNHTMHHRGAKNLEEAEYEVGEPSKLIWKLYPNESKLLVFAGGGGIRVKWGGEKWNNASKAYKDMVQSYYLIDLYDGKHPHISVNSEQTARELCNIAGEARDQNRHLALVFHTVGNATIKDFIKSIIWGFKQTISRNEFADVIKCLDRMRNQTWMSPLVNILKYEEEYKNAKLSVAEEKDLITGKLSINTDPKLYDHKLTLVIPERGNSAIDKIYQDDELITDSYKAGKLTLADLKPVASSVKIFYKAGQNAAHTATQDE